MSNLTNIELEEKAFEIFEETACEDSDFSALLAKTFLDGMKYYLFCKEDAWDYLGDNLSDFFQYVLDWNWEETISDPLEATKAYAEREAIMDEAKRDYDNKTPEYMDWKVRQC